MTQLAIVEAGPKPSPDLSQYNTPPKLAKALVRLVRPMLLDARRRGYALRVLEPSAGRGNLIRALRDVVGELAEVDAVELDPRWREDLVAAGATRVHIGSYLDRPAPARPYDLILSNPPFSKGEETEHLAKMLDETHRAAVLLPTRSKHGRKRHEAVWQRFDPRHGPPTWFIRGEVHCVGRWKFGEGGGTDEIDLMDLRRTPGPCVKGWL